jgi:hypothetical protein
MLKNQSGCQSPDAEPFQEMGTLRPSVRFLCEIGGSRACWKTDQRL